MQMNPGSFNWFMPLRAKTRVIRFTIKSDIVIAGKKKYMFYWEDITQNVRVQESLRLAAHTAEQANRSKSKFCQI